jgi:Tol biopolymer transport system component
MTPERWHRITDIFHAARLRNGEKREAFLVDACQHDSSLRPEIESLLAGDQAAGSFGKTPLVASVAALAPGTWLGSYRIETLIGAGGMGEVYRARDTKLNRDVALKILPEAFTLDGGRIARFRREAQVLASLNHPNIAAIYGFEDSGSTRALVLELVEGTTLADHIAQGPIPLDDALPIAKQIAEALEAAHERGIIHRDIKPANIKCTRDGHVKVLDFGLAKITVLEAVSDGASQLPASSITATQPGLIVGTAAYMSPEQTRGQAVDSRTDIWAFGCVLFEMLTGCAAFDGDTRSDLIAAILDRNPRWDQLPAATPPSIHQLVRRCLEKDPKRRLHDIADARLDIDDARTVPAISDGARRVVRSRRVAALTAAAALSGAAIVGVTARYVRGVPAAEAPPIRFAVLPDDAVPRRGVPSLSPDGRRLAFIARHDGVPMVWIRPLDAVDAQPVPGSEDAYSPFWSFDGGKLAFTGRDGLKVLDLADGRVRVLGGQTYAGSLGGMWCPDGRIVLGSVSKGLFAFSPTGGSPPTQLTAFDTAHGEGAQLFPTMLPDGRHFLYLSEPWSSIWVGSLDSKETTRLMRADSQAIYVPPGYLLFVRRQTLFAQRFDPDRLLLAESAMPIANSLMTELTYGADFTASSTGVLAYRTGTVHVRSQLTWVTRTGTRLGTVGPPGRYANIELSPDGSRVAFESFDSRTSTKDIWVMDLDRGIPTQLTFDPDNEGFPIWSPDGDWIMFASDREGAWQLYKRRASGIGAEERVATTVEAMVPQDWVPNSESVVYLQRPANLGVLRLAEPRTRELIDRARFEGVGRLDGYGQVSNDGRWMLYSSNEAEQFDVYLQRFPNRDAGKWKISDTGGISPRWGPGGRELFYYSSTDSQIVAVPLTIGSSVKIGAAAPLFKVNLVGGGFPSILWRIQYAPTNDGQRFLLNEALEDAHAHAPLTVVTNWMAGLHR